MSNVNIMEVTEPSDTDLQSVHMKPNQEFAEHFFVS